MSQWIWISQKSGSLDRPFKAYSTESPCVFFLTSRQRNRDYIVQLGDKDYVSIQRLIFALPILIFCLQAMCRSPWRYWQNLFMGLGTGMVIFIFILSNNKDNIFCYSGGMIRLQKDFINLLCFTSIFHFFRKYTYAGHTHTICTRTLNKRLRA